jgi:acetyl-CoA acetyltransferase
MQLQTPIIIGVADIENRPPYLTTANCKEPAQLIHEAILAAIRDTQTPTPEILQASIDSIDVVRTWTWPYPDLPGLLAEKLGVKEKVKRAFYSEHGGNQPGRLFDEAARRVSRGECEVAVVAGGEALASCECRCTIISLYP